MQTSVLGIQGTINLDRAQVMLGPQPWYNEKRTIGVVLDGAIYNSVQLRRELEDRGYRFQAK